MVKVDLDKGFTDLSGNTAIVKDENGSSVKAPTMGQSLAMRLVAGQSDDFLKLYGWAVKLNAGEALELDDSDLQKLESFIKECKELNNMGKAQFWQEIQKAKESSK